MKEGEQSFNGTPEGGYRSPEFKVKDREFKVEMLLGDGEHEFDIASLQTDLIPTEKNFDFQEGTRQQQDAYLGAKLKKQGEGTLFNGLGVSLNDTRLENGNLFLEFRPAHYFDYIKTNFFVTSPEGKELKNSIPDPRNLKDSPLSNNTGIMFTIVTGDEQIILTRRRSKVAEAKGLYNASLSKAMDFSKDMGGTNVPDPIITIKRAMKEDYGLNIETDQIHLLGVTLDTDCLAPSIIGCIQLPQKASEVRFEQDYKHSSWEERRIFTPPDKIENWLSDPRINWSNTGAASLLMAKKFLQSQNQ